MASFICLPIQLAFYVHDLTDPSWVSFNLIIDIIFVVDIVLNFQTGYVIPSTDEVSYLKFTAYLVSLKKIDL